ncbi:hypothetical protein FDO65_14050 [Nakamurella flava]|uniref:Uncharacterized protein n=1 Tax=Nakamurella flava TaxID=2576308 RepID=A0A4U6QEI6_9ACTN|nr:hypothetical protein [Nakamurella flava]TKV58644.1 hypothetical protein FDO65_14050 [Nakamurella flava]
MCARPAIAGMLALVIGLAMTSAPSAGATEPAPVVSSAAQSDPTPLVAAVGPTRVVDTRAGLGRRGPLPAGASLVLPIAGRADVPAEGAGVVILTVTVPTPSAAGALHVFAADQQATTPLVHFTAGRTVSTQVWVPVARTGPQAGSVTVRNDAAVAVPLVVDVTGWTSSATSPEAGGYVPVSPSELTATPVAAGASLVVPVAGRGGVPAGARAALLSVSVTDSRVAGWLTARPTDRAAGASPPAALNFSAGVDITGPALVPLAADGSVVLDNRSSGRIGLRVDVVGWLPSGAAVAGGLAVLPATRIIDTRSGLGLAGRSGPLGPGGLDLTLTGRGGVPVQDVAAVVVQVTAVDPTRDGYLRLAPSTVPAPAGVAVNFPARGSRTGTALVALDGNGQARLENPTSSVQHVVVDVLGYVTRPAESTDLRWTGPTDTVGGLGQAVALSCPPSTPGAGSFCLAVGTTGWAVRTGATWTAGAGSPPPTGRDGLSCTSPTFCMAVGGTAVSVFDGSAWRAVTPPTADFLTDVSCHGASTCVLVAADGRDWVWTGASWTARSPVFTGDGDEQPEVTEVSCASDLFCGAVGTRSWFWTGSGWGGPDVLPNSDTTAVSCPVDGFCAVVGSGGSGLAVYRQGARTQFEQPQSPTSVACTDATFCVAVGVFSQQTGRSDAITVWDGATWTDPFGPPITVPGEPVLVSCPNAGLCVALQDDARQILGTRG